MATTPTSKQQDAVGDVGAVLQIRNQSQSEIDLISQYAQESLLAERHRRSEGFGAERETLLCARAHAAAAAARAAEPGWGGGAPHAARCAHARHGRLFAQRATALS